jgi:hypothetical protein
LPDGSMNWPPYANANLPEKLDLFGIVSCHCSSVLFLFKCISFRVTETLLDCPQT